jgi:DoxX-like family
MVISTSPQASRLQRRMGLALTGLVVLFLLLDAGMKLVPLPQVTDTMRTLGFADSVGLSRGLGVLMLVITVLHVIPKTSALGAVLLTGYLGGAMAIQLRVGAPVLTHLLFGAYVACLMWAGLLVRSPRLRAAILSTPFPSRSTP